MIAALSHMTITWTGQDSYMSLMPQYARGAAGIMMMCDVTRIDTINNIRKWKQEAEKVIGSTPPSLLLVNKVSNDHYMFV